MGGAWPTRDFRDASLLPDPFKPGYKAGAALKFAKEGPISDPQAARTEIQGITTLGSTGGAVITEKKD
jgi:hypothetical protein